MDPEFSERAVIVTGAAAGVGRAIAEGFAGYGADVVVADIDLAAAEATAAALGGGGDHSATEVDVSDEPSVEAMVDEVLAAHGSVDILVNNAGVFQTAEPTVQQSVDEWQRVMDVHVRGTYLCSRAAAPSMLEQGRGAIVNISSNAGIAAFPYRTAYSPAKAAINMLTKVLAVEWAVEGIRVNVVAPSFVDKERSDERIEGGGFDPAPIERRTPTGRLVSPSSIAESVAFLASDRIPDVTGVVLPVDGGWTAYGYY